MTKSFFVECPKKHAVKYLILGKERNFGSERLLFMWIFLCGSRLVALGKKADAGTIIIIIHLIFIWPDLDAKAPA